MPTSDRQKAYNKKWRDKQAKIRAIARDLDELEATWEKLPKCKACQADRLRCAHTPAHRALEERTELTRSKLRDLEH